MKKKNQITLTPRESLAEGVKLAALVRKNWEGSGLAPAVNALSKWEKDTRRVLKNSSADALTKFGAIVLTTLEAHEEWSADTTDVISKFASTLKLAELDREGMFKRTTLGKY